LTGPSPDWIVGVSGLNLCKRDCTWIDEIIVDLYPWDAGTDNGITYMVIILTECQKLYLPDSMKAGTECNIQSLWAY
jgi:hypothetical protein